jgi:ubiquinone biosynthesis UbiH/UbiF/VisC/COQ6 family hydroxylase
MSGGRVLIAGGGMVGLAFAIALKVRLGTRLSVELIESRALPSGDPDPLDSRASALNLRSCRLLAAFGIWDDLRDVAAPIRDVHVSNQRRFGSALLHARDLDGDALGFVAENHHIGRALLRRAEALGVLLRAPLAIASLPPPDAGVGLLLASGEQEAADLVILADGSQSSLRDALGIAVDERHTGQLAVVANVAFSGKQQGIAFERFTAHGPLALLPLTDSKPGEQRFNLVWSQPEADGEALMAADDQAFMQALQAAFGWRLGKVLAVGRRTAWPLVRTRATEQSRPGYLVAGNAAHALHPVAGQGFNLSLRDADAFASVAQDAVAAGESPGDRQVLRHYEQRVSDDQSLTIGATDTLATLFNRRSPLLDVPRDAALAALDLSPELKRQVAVMGTGEQRGMESL